MSTNIETAALQFGEVSKRYRKHSALNSISFAIAPGQCAVIAGINGAGKTTLLRCLLSFTQPDQGTIRIAGIDSRLPASRQALAFLPEQFVPPQHLTGHEALQWLAGLHGQTWLREQTRAVLEEFSLPPEAQNRALRHFSKGMTQKLGLAAVLASGKRILVLDEPMSGLDALARRHVVSALLKARAQGRTIVLTSHSLAEVAALCDVLVVIEQGALRFCGAPKQLCELSGAAELEDAFVRCVTQVPDQESPYVSQDAPHHMAKYEAELQ